MLDHAFEEKSADKLGHANGNGNGAGRKLPLKGSYPPQDVEAVDIYKLLDELEELPDRAKHIPFMPRVLLGFDLEQFFYLVLKVRANLPEDMKKAQRVARDSERIVVEAKDTANLHIENSREEVTRIREGARAEAESTLQKAREEADRILNQARAQAAHMVEKTEIHQMATAQAHDLIRRAETESSEIRKGADEYARDVLASLEGTLGKAVTTIQRGRETLERARAA